MIDTEERFATLTHLSLSSEQLFRRGFVRHLSVGSYICEAIDRFGTSVFSASNQAATFVGGGFASVRDDFAKMRLTECKRWARVIRYVDRTASPVQ